MKLHYLFPSLVLTDQLEHEELNLVKEEIEGIFPEINELLMGDIWHDNVYSTSNKCSCLITEYKLQNTFRCIDSVVQELASKLKITPEGLSLVESWINITTQFGYQDLHIHGYNLLSGVLYLNIPFNSGTIQFTPSISKSTITPAESFTPKEGFITAFHGSVPHRVTYNKTSKQRISLSFNYSYKI